MNKKMTALPIDIIHSIFSYYEWYLYCDLCELVGISVKLNFVFNDKREIPKLEDVIQFHKCKEHPSRYPHSTREYLSAVKWLTKDKIPNKVQSVCVNTACKYGHINIVKYLL